MPVLRTIDQYLGLDGTDAEEIHQGEQWTYQGAVVDSGDGSAVSLSRTTMTATAEFYRLQISTESREELTIERMQPDGANQPRDISEHISITNASGGLFTLTIPADLYPVPIEANTVDNVAAVVVWITLTTEGIPLPTIDKERIMLVVRHAR